ncbi:MAG: hypothetical protein HYX73_08255 [Acidobacteria bacterium]|nr:hypothetical protein [Acidobacteriota bacterium]
MLNSQHIAERVNAVAVTTEELLDVAADSAQLHRQEPQGVDAEALMILVVKRYHANSKKAFAIFSRMRALAVLIEEQRVPGWTLPALTDGGVPTPAAVFAAAAKQPLIQRGEELVFEGESFLERVLELAEPAGTA